MRQDVRRRRRDTEVDHARLRAVQLDVLGQRRRRGAREQVTASTATAPGAQASPEWGAGHWCDVFEVRDWKIQRGFIYLDPDYAGKDTARYPWLAEQS